MDAIASHREVGIGDIEMRIDAKSGRKEAGSVRLIAIEEIAIIEIAVGPGIGNRLGCLVQREVVPFGQYHLSAPFNLAMLLCCNARAQPPRAMERKHASPRFDRLTLAALITALTIPRSPPTT